MTTDEVAKKAGVHKATLLRWLRLGLVAEPGRDARGWRSFSTTEVEVVARFAQTRSQVAEAPGAYGFQEVHPSVPDALHRIDWDFADASTGYLTHGLHPYPAKFIPQIPNALIQELSSVGDTVLDPFCGSGTTLVEALLLKRHAVGVDANPLACLISRAKTLHMTDAALIELQRLEPLVQALRSETVSGQLSLFARLSSTESPRHPYPELDFWFEPQVASELAWLKELCAGLESEEARTLALSCLSSIIVAVSKQDSDTRYVRREKGIEPGETVRRFERALSLAVPRALEFAALAESRFSCIVLNHDVLDAPPVGPVDLVVSSPPYPNAYSYHLYHRTRLLWLDMDADEFKRREIGSHRKYSSRSPKAATPETFQREMSLVFRWIGDILNARGYCCFVVGDSIVRGKLVRNEEILTSAAAESSFRLKAQLRRRLRDSKKSFNPKIGKIREEHILVFQKER